MATPRFDDIRDRCHVVSIPLSTPFRGLPTREVLLLEGPAGPA
ncbi:MAG: O-succinylbenzoate synthase, partial [Microbacteriaceae bacterium]|nr:O-succinylbenzoate synthase [Microbacteriaceae bacterium]